MRPIVVLMLAGVARALVAPAAKRPRLTRAFAAAGDPRETLEKAVASALGAAFGPEYNDPSKAALRSEERKKERQSFRRASAILLKKAALED